jgi:vacuolar-type H+-ATPase subunit E/Vma4
LLIAQLPSEEVIRAETQTTFRKLMARFDADMAKELKEAHQQITIEATKVKPELQPGFMRERNAAVEANATQLRRDYANQVQKVISEWLKEMLEQKRWEDLNEKLDALLLRGHDR